MADDMVMHTANDAARTHLAGLAVRSSAPWAVRAAKLSLTFLDRPHCAELRGYGWTDIELFGIVPDSKIEPHYFGTGLIVWLALSPWNSVKAGGVLKLDSITEDGNGVRLINSRSGSRFGKQRLGPGCAGLVPLWQHPAYDRSKKSAWW